MGLNPALETGSQSLVHPTTGRPISANDPAFLSINDQLADKG